VLLGRPPKPALIFDLAANFDKSSTKPPLPARNGWAARNGEASAKIELQSNQREKA